MTNPVDELERLLERYGLVLTDNPDFEHSPVTFEQAKECLIAAIKAQEAPDAEDD